VQIALERVNSHTEIIVSDTGEGIKPEFLPHVFERFRQADDSSTRHHGGLGLGLAIVRTIVELHGGTVHAMSDGEGRGATFTVTLPIPAVLNAPAAPAVERTIAPTLAGLRLLFVDDQADAREAVQAVLEQFGAAVITAATVEEAARLVDAYKPDAVLADIAMPGQDGFALIQRMKDQATRRVPIAALTAYGPEHRDRILDAGFEMYIGKPIQPPDLAMAVRRLAGTPTMH
jgi:CheY-like chemotaxis protein